MATVVEVVLHSAFLDTFSKLVGDVVCRVMLILYYCVLSITGNYFLTTGIDVLGLTSNITIRRSSRPLEDPNVFGMDGIP